MPNKDDGFFESESVRVALLIDRVTDRFESSWRSGVAPDIAEFIARVTGYRRIEILEELIGIDQIYRSNSGEQRTRQDCQSARASRYHSLPISERRS